MSETVPEGWEETNLSGLVSVDAESLKGNTNPEYKFKYIDISCVSTGEVKPPSQHILFHNAPSRAKRIVRKNDVLVATVRPNLKAFAHFDEEGEDWIASTGFAVLRNKEQADSRFIYNVMLSDDVSRQIEKLVAGSNYPAINSSDIKELSVLSPPLLEQKKIASILTSVDEVIETTQKQIDKLQDLKKATMNELLTKGIGHTEFKDSELGRIPKSWEVTNLEQYCSSVRDGTHESPKRTTTGYQLVTSKNLKSGKLDFSTCYNISNEDFHSINQRSKVDAFDILFGMIGTVGNPVVVQKNDLPFAIKNVALLKFDSDKNKSAWLFAYLDSSLCTQKIDKDLSGSTQSFISLGYLRNFNIPVPTALEQVQITKISAAINDQIQKYSMKLSQTQSLKKSLMQDLLTGKVRVQVN